jgi:hypothetical protein
MWDAFIHGNWIGMNFNTEEEACEWLESFIKEYPEMLKDVYIAERSNNGVQRVILVGDDGLLEEI